MRRLSLVLLVQVALLWLCDAGDAAMKPTLIIRLEQNDSSLAPSIVAFGPNGQIYTAYRTHGPQHQSSAMWVRAFDSNTGRELRQAQVKAPAVQLPQTASMFQVSPDGKLLLYVETPAIIGPNQAAYVAVLDAATLQVVSSSDLVLLSLSHSRIFGFGNDSHSVILGSSVERTGPKNHPLTESVRVVEVKSEDLHKVVREQVIANPFESYGYTIDASGTLWFSKDAFISKSFSEYDPAGKTVLREISFGGDYGLSRVLFLRESILGFTHEASHDATFGQVLRFEPSKAAPAQTERVSGCGFKQATVSPDQSFAVGVCDEQSQAELNFGALTVCNAVVLRTSTLQILASIPLSKRTTWHSVAVWHGSGQVRVATSDESPDGETLFAG